MSTPPRKSEDIEAYGVDNTDNMMISAPLSKITTSGTNNEFIHIGDTRVLRSELVEAVGFNNQLHQAPMRKFANSSVLGLCAFALSTFVLAMCNIKVRNMQNPNILVGLAFFYGGMVQILVGMWEIIHQNTFACTTFTSYGAFYLSYGALFTPSFGIMDAYAKTPEELPTAIAIYSAGWFIFSFLMTIVTIRSSWPLFLMFITITMSFMLNMIGYFSGVTACITASGGFSFATAFFGWYMAMEGLSGKETCYFKLLPLLMPGAQHVSH